MWPSQGLLEDFGEGVFPAENPLRFTETKEKSQFSSLRHNCSRKPKTWLPRRVQPDEPIDEGVYLPSATPRWRPWWHLGVMHSPDHSLWCHMLPSSAIFLSFIFSFVGFFYAERRGNLVFGADGGYLPYMMLLNFSPALLH